MGIDPLTLKVGDKIRVTLVSPDGDDSWSDEGTVGRLEPLVDNSVTIYAGLEFNSSGCVDAYPDDEHVVIEKL